MNLLYSHIGPFHCLAADLRAPTTHERFRFPREQSGNEVLYSLRLVNGIQKRGLSCLECRSDLETQHSAEVSKGRDCFSMQTRGGLNATLSSDILLFLFIPRGIKASAKASCRGGVGISNHQVRTNISLKVSRRKNSANADPRPDV